MQCFKEPPNPPEGGLNSFNPCFGGFLEVVIDKETSVTIDFGHLGKQRAGQGKKAEIKAIYKFTAPIQIDNFKYEALLVVRETLQGRFYYDHNLSEIKKPGGISGNSPHRENMHQPSPGTKKSKEKRNKKQRYNPSAPLIHIGTTQRILIEDGNNLFQSLFWWISISKQHPPAGGADPHNKNDRQPGHSRGLISSLKLWNNF